MESSIPKQPIPKTKLLSHTLSIVRGHTLATQTSYTWRCIFLFYSADQEDMCYPCFLQFFHRIMTPRRRMHLILSLAASHSKSDRGLGEKSVFDMNTYRVAWLHPVRWTLGNSSADDLFCYGCLITSEEGLHPTPHLSEQDSVKLIFIILDFQYLFYWVSNFQCERRI